jgi:hypothetical protein
MGDASRFEHTPDGRGRDRTEQDFTR